MKIPLIIGFLLCLWFFSKSVYLFVVLKTDGQMWVPAERGHHHFNSDALKGLVKENLKKLFLTAYILLSILAIYRLNGWN